MPTEVVKIDRQRDYRDALRRAVTVLHAAGLVGFPTETVYGVGVRADQRQAVELLRRVKNREARKPFTVHIGAPDEVERFVGPLSAYARRFVRRAWPGPVTVVFPVPDPAVAPIVQLEGVDASLIYHDGTVGIRCPDDAVAAELLTLAGVPVVAASANRAGNPPARTAAGVVAALDGRINLVLDAGESRYAQPSTVVMFRGNDYDVLRHGVIDERTLKRFSALTLLFVCSGNTCRSPMAAALCRRMLAAKRGCEDAELPKRAVYVSSAGAFATVGSPASAAAVQVLRQRGVDLSRHSSQALDAGAIEGADHVLCMTRAHVDAVLALAPSAASKTALLGGEEEIGDPFGGSVETYDTCAQRIEAALASRLAEIDS